MELNDYTKKIIRRLAIVFAGIGIVCLIIGIYLYDFASLFASFLALLMAHTSYRVGKSRHDSN